MERCLQNGGPYSPDYISFRSDLYRPAHKQRVSPERRTGMDRPCRYSDDSKYLWSSGCVPKAKHGFAAIRQLIGIGAGIAAENDNTMMVGQNKKACSRHNYRPFYSGEEWDRTVDRLTTSLKNYNSICIFEHPSCI